MIFICASQLFLRHDYLLKALFLPKTDERKWRVGVSGTVPPWSNQEEEKEDTSTKVVKNI